MKPTKRYIRVLLGTILFFSFAVSPLPAFAQPDSQIHIDQNSVTIHLSPDRSHMVTVTYSYTGSILSSYTVTDPLDVFSLSSSDDSVTTNIINNSATFSAVNGAISLQIIGSGGDDSLTIHNRVGQQDKLIIKPISPSTLGISKDTALNNHDLLLSATSFNSITISNQVNEDDTVSVGGTVGSDVMSAGKGEVFGDWIYTIESVPFQGQGYSANHSVTITGMNSLLNRHFNRVDMGVPGGQDKFILECANGNDVINIDMKGIADGDIEYFIGTSRIPFDIYAIDVVEINGHGGDDTFSVSPNVQTDIYIIGGNPLPLAMPGDRLSVLDDLLTSNVNAVSEFEFIVLDIAHHDDGASGSYSYEITVPGLPKRSPIFFSQIEQITPAGTLGGTVFHDLDADGSQDIDEPYLPAQVVRLFNQSQVEVSSQSSSPTGSFNFINLSVGQYRINAIPLSGWLATTPDNQIALITQLDQPPQQDFYFGVVHPADLDVTAAQLGGPVYGIGQNVTFRIDVTNSGPATADEVDLAIRLPVNSVFGSITTQQPGGWNCSQPDENGVIHCTCASFESGWQTEFQVEVQIGEPVVNSILTATVNSEIFDPTLTDNYVSLMTSQVRPLYLPLLRR